MNSIILLVLEILIGIILLVALVWALSRAFKYDLFYDSKLGEEDMGDDLTKTNKDDDKESINHQSI